MHVWFGSGVFEVKDYAGRTIELVARVVGANNRGVSDVEFGHRLIRFTKQLVLGILRFWGSGLPSPWGIAAIWGRRCGAAAMFDGIFGPAASNSDTEELGSGEVDTQCSASELQTMIHDWEHRDIPLPRTPPLAITDSTLAGKTPSLGQQDFVVADTNVETAASAQDHGPDHCAPSSPPRCRSRSRSRLQSRLQHAHAIAKATGIAVDRVAPLIEAYSAWQPQLVAHFKVLRSRQLQRYRMTRSLLMEGVGVGMGSCGVGFQAMVCCGCVFCFDCVGENG